MSLDSIRLQLDITCLIGPSKNSLLGVSIAMVIVLCMHGKAIVILPFSAGNATTTSKRYEIDGKSQYYMNRNYDHSVDW